MRATPEAGVAHGPDHHLEAQDGRFSRAHALPPAWRPDPTTESLFRTTAALLASEADGITRFRLIGGGVDALVEDVATDPSTLFDRETPPATAARATNGSNSHQARRPIGAARPRSAGHRHTARSPRHCGAGKEGDRMSSCEGDQQLGLPSGSISSSLALIE